MAVIKQKSEKRERKRKRGKRRVTAAFSGRCAVVLLRFVAVGPRSIALFLSNLKAESVWATARGQQRPWACLGSTSFVVVVDDDGDVLEREACYLNSLLFPDVCVWCTLVSTTRLVLSVCVCLFTTTKLSSSSSSCGQQLLFPLHLLLFWLY